MNPPARLLARQKTVAALVIGALLAVGVALYSTLPEQMAIHWNAAGEPDNVVSKPVAVLAMPAVVVFMSVLFELTNNDVGERIVGSLAMLLLLVVQMMAFGVNLGYDVPIVPITLALAGGMVAVAVWVETR
ncbi:DUF1648 domain-containing protein [Halorubrum halodurans]|uniref:DUF1648 domain-containing protein n=1 Tax=Halorubrum halodurans TaxID=1383851 RepID=A0A256ISD5_9EURY|nr:DUF1648 domain-containing protein [Halorubrum halodurans]OYR59451.1 hypothetical protein DJ70_00325 [Halorubrum halodurans]